MAQFEEAAGVELCWRAVLQKADSTLGHLGNLITALLREDSGRKRTEQRQISIYCHMIPRAEESVTSEWPQPLYSCPNPAENLTHSRYVSFGGMSSEVNRLVPQPRWRHPL